MSVVDCLHGRERLLLWWDVSHNVCVKLKILSPICVYSVTKTEEQRPAALTNTLLFDAAPTKPISLSPQPEPITTLNEERRDKTEEGTLRRHVAQHSLRQWSHERWLQLKEFNKERKKKNGNYMDNNHDSNHSLFMEGECTAIGSKTTHQQQQQ